jgi:transcriptional regulator with XRE-family HTH domain
MQAKTEEEPVDVRARRRLRELRTERGLTLQQVAERASIDVSTLSRLEAGKRRLALDHIPALAAALDVSADELLRSSPPQDPRVRGRPRNHEGLTLWPLTRSTTAGGLRAYKVHVRASRRTPPDVLPVHEGQDWLYVLDGRLRLVLGEQDLTIEPGDAVEFTTWTPHWFGALDGPVELILIVGPQGERLHLQP